AAWEACIADARPLDAYARLLRDARLRVIHRESHDPAIGRMLDQIEARLTLLRITGADRLAAAQLDLDAVARYLDLTRPAVADRHPPRPARAPGHTRRVKRHHPSSRQPARRRLTVQPMARGRRARH